MVYDGRCIVLQIFWWILQNRDRKYIYIYIYKFLKMELFLIKKHTHRHTVWRDDVKSEGMFGSSRPLVATPQCGSPPSRGGRFARREKHCYVAWQPVMPTKQALKETVWKKY
jgi:hypothetical protein